jgi:hypothetical protein
VREGDDGDTPDNDSASRARFVPCEIRIKSMTPSDRRINGGVGSSVDLVMKGLLTSLERWITC